MKNFFKGILTILKMAALGGLISLAITIANGDPESSLESALYLGALIGGAITFIYKIAKYFRNRKREKSQDDGGHAAKKK